MFVTSKRYEKLLSRVLDLESQVGRLESDQSMTFGETLYFGASFYGDRQVIKTRKVVRMLMELAGVEVVSDPGTSPSLHLASVEVDDD